MWAAQIREVWVRPRALVAAGIAAVLALAFQSNKADALALPPVHDIMDQFDAVAFGHEHGPSPGILRKWQQSPYLYFFAHSRTDVDQDFALIRHNASEIKALTGIPWRLSASNDKASLHFGFLPRAEFGRLPTAAAITSSQQAFLNRSACIALAASDADSPGAIRKAAIVIGTDIPLDLRRHCVLEEMVQVMGLPNDACHYRPSLFCESDFVTQMAAADRILLRTLYDQRLAAGMARAHALPIARAIIRSLTQQSAGDDQRGQNAARTGDSDGRTEPGRE
jgi:hypothetical protein